MRTLENYNILNSQKITIICQETDSMQFVIVGEKRIFPLLLFIPVLIILVVITAKIREELLFFTIVAWPVLLIEFSKKYFEQFGQTIFDMTPEWIRIRKQFWGVTFLEQMRTTAVKEVNFENKESHLGRIIISAGVKSFCKWKRLLFADHLEDFEKEWLIQKISEYLQMHSPSFGISQALFEKMLPDD